MFEGHFPQGKKELLSFYASKLSRVKGMISIPHSGEDVPEEFNSYLCGDPRAYQEDVDYKVNELIDIEALRSQGLNVLVAHVHRVCVDLNRDETLAVLAWNENTQGMKLVTKRPSEEERQSLLAHFYAPYYELLKAQILELQKLGLKKVPVVDLHSMPSRPTAYHMKQNPHQKTHRPDFCISNVSGKTSSEEYIDSLVELLGSRGYEVLKNDPYFGGHVTRWVGQFQTEVVQIEINRALYMDEKQKSLLVDKANQVKLDLTWALQEHFAKFGL